MANLTLQANNELYLDISLVTYGRSPNPAEGSSFNLKWQFSVDLALLVKLLLRRVVLACFSD